MKNVPIEAAKQPATIILPLLTLAARWESQQIAAPATC
jgi:hypothetical protein